MIHRLSDPDSFFIEVELALEGAYETLSKRWSIATVCVRISSNVTSTPPRVWVPSGLRLLRLILPEDVMGLHAWHTGTPLVRSRNRWSHRQAGQPGGAQVAI